MSDDDRLEIDITTLSSEGDGIGRDETGRVVFVPFTAPGDRVRVRVTSRRKRFLRASVETLLVPGEARAEPVCAVYGSCGGCSWQHVSYDAQLEAKARQVRDALERIAKLTAPAIETIPSPTPYAYRARARVVREGERVGYRRRRSRALCSITRCPVLTEPAERALRALAEDPEAEPGEWELAAGSAASEPARRTPVAAAEGGRVLLEAGGDRLEVSPGVFYQANLGLHEALIAAVLDAAGTGALALDLYAGAGFFTLGLARGFERVVAVESASAAVRDCRRNLEAAGHGNALVVPGRLEDVAQEAPLVSLRPEVVVLDPPRAGLGEPLAAWLADRGADRVVYLSCDPATLARDVGVLAERGYRLTRLQAFDLFPQTPHVEALAVLESANA